MDVLGLVDIPWWLAGVLCFTSLLLGLYAYTVFKQSTFRRLGIPGPKPVPFLGALPSFAKVGMAQADVDGVREYGKVFGTYIGNNPTLMITDPDMIKEICVKQFANFTDRAQTISIPSYWKKTVGNADGELWKFLRATLSPAFTSRKLKMMADIVDTHLQKFMKGLEGRLDGNTEIYADVQKLYSDLAMDVICSSAFGINVSSQETPDDPFVKHARSVMDMKFGGNVFVLLPLLFPWLGDVYRWLRLDFGVDEATTFLFQSCKSIVQQRKSEGGTVLYKDLLQLMIDANTSDDQDDFDEDTEDSFSAYKKRGLTDEEIVSNAVIFLLVGSDTTSTTLSWISYCLATNPSCQEKLLAEIDKELAGAKPTYETVSQLTYLDMVISETLRLYTPSASTNRKALKDVDVCGVRIPKDMAVTFPFPALHRHPDFWSDPSRFDPERFSPENKSSIRPFSYLPFGVGPRNCLGMRFALMQMKVVMATVLQEFRVEVSPQTDVPAKISKSFFLRPENGMWLKLVKR